MTLVACHAEIHLLIEGNFSEAITTQSDQSRKSARQSGVREETRMTELDPRAARASRLRNKVCVITGAGDDTSFITGQVIDCSGGQSQGRCLPLTFHGALPIERRAPIAPLHGSLLRGGYCSNPLPQAGKDGV